MLSLKVLLVVCGFLVLGYVIYQRHIHPLARFPGPFWASLTNFWRFYHELRGDLPRQIEGYHKIYGAFIRVAPDEIDTNAAEVVDIVYKKGGRHYTKTEFYNGFTTVRPNIFGTRDEAIHTVRRRQMAHAFSQASLVKMEYIFNRHVGNLIEALDRRIAQDRSFDVRTVLQYYAEDTNGDLSLAISFNSQTKDGPAALPLLNDHIALAKLTGYVPWTKSYFDKHGNKIPWPYLQRLLASRAKLRNQAEYVTDMEFMRAGRVEAQDRSNLFDAVHDEEDESERFNLFTSLVRAKDPETEEMVPRDDVISNALTFLTAGSHSTTATLAIAFWYLVHYPKIMNKVVDEIDKSFAPPTSDSSALDIKPFQGLESRLPYLAAVLNETFRLSPTFQHPAPRRTPESDDPRYPTIIRSTTIPPGYAISASVYSLHRNPAIWGENAGYFIPERWLDDRAKGKEGLLMHFGAGHRACIGRNQSLIMLWKAVVEVLRRFELRLIHQEGLDVEAEKEPLLRVTGFAELEQELPIIIKRRNLSPLPTPT